MPKFRFSLEAVLRARQIREREHQRHVAGIDLERQEIENQLRTLQDSITSKKGEMQSDLVGSVDTHVLRWQAAAVMQSMRQAQRAAVELAGIHRRLASARQSLIEASRDRRAIELLREKALQQWHYEQNKAETHLLDELASQLTGSRSDESANHDVPGIQTIGLA